MEELIAAVATGAVKSAVGVIRLSGEGAVDCAAKVFRPKGGGAFGAGAPRRLVLGDVVEAGGAVIDQALATYSRGPNSYTGEDTVELHCHGSPTVLSLVLEALYARGARPAKAGEFTRRAFLNGKLDLTQAEAVADLIDAQTPEAAKRAAGQLGGRLTERLDAVYGDLADVLAHFHVLVDYPDEDLEPMDSPQIAARLAAARAELEELLAGYTRSGRYLRGVPAAIVGLPNAGKSSLLNALLGYDRAIVTDVPGTTRDTVEETCLVGETLLRLTDTAGMREAGDEVERLGVVRSREAMERAALILVVADGSRPLTPEDEELIHAAAHRPDARTILVRSKADLPPAAWGPVEEVPMVEISAKTGAGMDRLIQAVRQAFPPEAADAAYFTNERQVNAGETAVKRLASAEEMLAQGMPPDGPLTDVEGAMAALGELTGRNIQEDVVDRIFSRFCVGK